MRPPRDALIVGVVLASYGAATAGLAARRLGELGPRERPSLDPLGTTLGALGLLLAVALYALLGRVVARRAKPQRDAAWSGAVAGALAGVASGSAQALAVADYLAGAAARAGAPDWLVPDLLVLYVVVATGASAASGGVVAWLAYVLSRRHV